MDIRTKSEILEKGLGVCGGEYPAYLLEILDKALIGILIIDFDARVLFVNQQYTKITGVKYEDIVNRRLRDVRPKAILGEVVKKRRSPDEHPREENGKKYFVDVAPIRMGARVIGGLTLMKDFEDARVISDKLKKAEERIRAIETVLKSTFNARYTFEDIIGDTPEFRKVISLAKKLAISDSSVLITGKTGTGKELFAQAMHNFSDRQNKPFVPVNCASIPNALIESELFGYAPGAFTDARKEGKVGLFELSNGGTLFLDEIENMSGDLQNKLLRVLQEKVLKKVGSNEYITVDVRILAATNIDIEQLVREGRFREDLYYRLCVFPLNIPELKDRSADIRPLVRFFLEKHNRKVHTDVTIDEEALSWFEQYRWPGNVRELGNTIEYLASIDDDGIISLSDLPNKRRAVNGDKDIFSAVPLKKKIKEYEKKILTQYLDRFGASVEDKEKIAGMMDISISTLYKKLSEYDLV
jgi:transcriptional regulator with PAS, ATPase and Fis domain